MEVELPETIEECHSLIRNLLAVIGRMQVEIEELKAKLNENSQNSNRSSLSDGFNKPKAAFSRQKGKRGGQLGHRGNTLKWVENPDLTVDCEPNSCLCGEPQWTGTGEISETRQVFEMPEPRLEVIEYRRVKRICKCGRSVCGEFPEKVVAPVQYGEKVQTLVSLLSVHGCLSYGKIGQMFADIYGYELNKATAQKMVQKTSARMPMEVIKGEIIASKVVNFDETGLTENGKMKWLHNASTSMWTYQYIHEKRGKEAMTDEKSVLPNFKGVAVHDCWGSYFGFNELKHALCNAHILRELNGIIENSQTKWAIKMKELLLEMYRKSEFGKGIIEEISEYIQRYEAVLEAAEKEEPPPERVSRKGKLKRTKGRNLLERLRKHEESVLRFATQSEVPFTNNQAERDIRPTKIKQKMSGGFRSESGTTSYCRIQSFISSLRKQSRQVFQELLSVIQGNHFEVFQT